MCMAAILLLIPTVQVQSGDALKIQQRESLWLSLEEDISRENIETISPREAIFKDGIVKSIKHISNINQLPKWGMHIDYYRNTTWKKMDTVSVKKLNLPEKLDIMPRNITTPIKSIILHLGNRKFAISVDGGKIKNISFDATGLKVKTNILWIRVTYNQEEELPDLMYRLWTTPRGPWEKTWFSWTTVMDVSSQK